jgi:hypothetical protein
MTPTCPKCHRPIPAADINVAQNVAFCRVCNLAHPLAALVHGLELEAGVDASRPPAGAWSRGAGMGTVIGATYRSIGSAIGALFMALFWNGIVSVFVALATSATLTLLGWPIPAWFPAPKMNHQEMGLGETLFLWLFLTPFIVIGLGLAGAVLRALFGWTEVRIDAGEAMVATGIGPWAWRRRFRPETVKDIRLETVPSRNRNGVDREVIAVELDSGRLIKFGGGLREDRKRFVAAAARQVLLTA